MEIRRTTPSKLFIVTGAGAGLDFSSECSHGDPILSLHLFSRGEDVVDDIAVLMPACLASEVFGMSLAYVEAVHGAEASGKFLDAMLARKDNGVTSLRERRASYEASHPVCCTAAAFTRGVDHTCGRTS
ncbi:hypothetical protein [Streptomyces coerulescens]|uniref:Uncharacterized protein n=1 Tax=Streptomyces coerulescens TaxID=29304 RepID=A0ABW0CPV3_STRCD